MARGQLISLGHPSGDRVLLGVAERLKGCLREADAAARLGGDEFVAVLGDVAERFRARLRAPQTFGNTGCSRPQGSASLSVPRSGPKSCCVRRTWRCTKPRVRAKDATWRSTSVPQCSTRAREDTLEPSYAEGVRTCSDSYAARTFGYRAPHHPVR